MLFGITIITFTIMNLSGKPTDLMTDMNAKIDADSKKRLEKLSGFDKPMHVRYIIWIKHLAKFDFMTSHKDGRKVTSKIFERLPRTLLLNVVSLIIIFGVALPIGIISALKQNSIVDKGLSLFVFIGFSIPTFWLALLLMDFLGIRLGILPVSGWVSINHDELGFIGKIFDIAKHLILPASVAAFGGLAGLSRYSRSSMLEVIHQDYIKMARAKGIPESKVIWKHALKNAFLPVVTILGLSLPELIGGSFIFETIFNYPGMGRLGYEAIMARDHNVVMGIGVMVALLTLLGNFIADITYAYVDPRIRYK